MGLPLVFNRYGYQGNFTETDSTAGFISYLIRTGQLGNANSQFSPAAYGALGNGTWDDTAGIQAMFNAAFAAGGNVVFPKPQTGKFWNITSAITIGDGVSFPSAMRISAPGLVFSDIRYTGPSGAVGAMKPVFKNYGGAKSCIVDSVPTYISGAHDIVVWDLDTTAAEGSTSNITFINCLLSMNNGINNVGYRFGHVSGGGADVSNIQFLDCTIGTSGSVPAGTRGLLVEGGNTFQFLWMGGGGFGMDKFCTNESGSGATSGLGGGMFTFIGAGCSNNNVDFEVNNSNLVVSGGRFENGKRFIQNDTNSQSPGVANYTITGVEIDGYNSDYLGQAGCDGTFLWDNNQVLGLTVSSGYVFNLRGVNKGTFKARGGGVGSTSGLTGFCRVDDPANSPWSITLDDVWTLNNGSSVITGRFSSVQTDSSATPGNVTQNSCRFGKAAFAAGAATVVVTNNLITAASAIFAQLQTADGTLTSIKAAVSAAGSVTFSGNANATAITKFIYEIR